MGKLGYSTVAEVYHAGVPYGYVARPRFRESPVLADFIQRQMKGLQITKSQFQSGHWLSRLPDLLALPRLTRDGPNGADQVAGFISQLLAKSG
ncbi:MAG: hypothetical protein JXM69_14815 [Anaerolineae bacterium]|nr:hypothetical protein [Anaerolineae bacterium]